MMGFLSGLLAFIFLFNYVTLVVSTEKPLLGEIIYNQDSCWDVGVKDYLPSTVDCQIYCSTTPKCNSWAYNVNRNDKRCHLCTGKQPRADTSDLCNDPICSTWGHRHESYSVTSLLNSALSIAQKVCSGEVDTDLVQSSALDMDVVSKAYKRSNEEIQMIIKTSIQNHVSILADEDDICFDQITGPDNPCTYGGLLMKELRIAVLTTELGSEAAFPKARDRLRKDLLDKHSIFIEDNGYFNTRSLKSLSKFYDQLPAHLMENGVLAYGFARQSVKDAFICDDSTQEQNTRRLYNVFKVQVGSRGGSGFPLDTPDRGLYSDDKMTVTRHEVAHQFDRAVDSRLRSIYDKLRLNSKGSDENWLRSNVGDEFFQRNPQEIIASQIGNQYLQSTSSQLRLAAYRLTRDTSTHEFPTVTKVTKTVSGHGCKTPSKQLGTSFENPEQCSAAAMKDPDCGDEIQWSGYSYAWGCYCCEKVSKKNCPVFDDLYSANGNWDVYQYSNPSPNDITCKTSGTPLSWFLFNLDLMTEFTTGSSKSNFYENETENGTVTLVSVTVHRDLEHRISSIDIPACGKVEVTYGDDDVVNFVSENAVSCHALKKKPVAVPTAAPTLMVPMDNSHPTNMHSTAPSDEPTSTQTDDLSDEPTSTQTDDCLMSRHLLKLMHLMMLP